MRRTPLLLILLPLSAACVDGLGISSSCSADMSAVRIAHGAPDDSERNEDRGDYIEEWYYDEGRRRFTFRWGASYDRCQTQSGNFIVSPAPEPTPVPG